MLRVSSGICRGSRLEGVRLQGFGVGIRVFFLKCSGFFLCSVAHQAASLKGLTLGEAPMVIS